jgi:hypothetical protein
MLTETRYAPDRRNRTIKTESLGIAAGGVAHWAWVSKSRSGDGDPYREMSLGQNEQILVVVAVV